MKAICINLQAHQPFRFRKYRFFDIGNDHYYYDDFANETTMQKAANATYLPSNKILLELLQREDLNFKVNITLSGLALEQFDMYAPEVLDSLKDLANTGKVEFIATPYSYSLASIKSASLFKKDVAKQCEAIKLYFNQTPKVLCNTELIYSDEIAILADEMGFEGVLTEGAKHILGWKSPNYLYQSAECPNLKLLMRNFQLCDDLSFRFSNHDWNEYPLTAEKYVDWMNNNSKEEVINLFIGYDVFGGFQAANTGIFEFLKSLPAVVKQNSAYTFATASEIMSTLEPKSMISVTHPISWSNEERDLSIWTGNAIQNEAIDKLLKLESRMDKVTDYALNRDWNCLQACNHFYLMGKMFYIKLNPHLPYHGFDSPYESFINYMNILSDFETRLNIIAPDNKSEAEIDLLNKLLRDKELELEKCKKEIGRLKKKPTSRK
ncbi:MAG: glycoside hydrolase family 57 protein [Mangrovibacterium sp.]